LLPSFRKWSIANPQVEKLLAQMDKPFDAGYDGKVSLEEFLDFALAEIVKATREKAKRDKLRELAAESTTTPKPISRALTEPTQSSMHDLREMMMAFINACESAPSSPPSPTTFFEPGDLDSLRTDQALVTLLDNTGALARLDPELQSSEEWNANANTLIASVAWRSSDGKTTLKAFLAAWIKARLASALRADAAEIESLRPPLSPPPLSSPPAEETTNAIAMEEAAQNEFDQIANAVVSAEGTRSTGDDNTTFGFEDEAEAEAEAADDTAVGFGDEPEVLEDTAFGFDDEPEDEPKSGSEAEVTTGFDDVSLDMEAIPLPDSVVPPSTPAQMSPFAIKSATIKTARSSQPDTDGGSNSSFGVVKAARSPQPDHPDSGSNSAFGIVKAARSPHQDTDSGSNGTFGFVKATRPPQAALVGGTNNAFEVVKRSSQPLNRDGAAATTPFGIVKFKRPPMRGNSLRHPKDVEASKQTNEFAQVRTSPIREDALASPPPAEQDLLAKAMEMENKYGKGFGTDSDSDSD
jgi:hypothetical protein